MRPEELRSLHLSVRPDDLDEWMPLGADVDAWVAEYQQRILLEHHDGNMYLGLNAQC